MVIYDYNTTGHEIVKQETIHEYKERIIVGKIKKRNRSVGKQWDMTSCKKQAELNKIITDAWRNINRGDLRLSPNEELYIEK